MIPTEIIGRSHHKYPRLQRQGLVGKRSSPSNKGRQMTAKGGIQPFYRGGVDVFAGASCLQYRLNGLVGSLYHFVFDSYDRRFAYCLMTDRKSTRLNSSH